MTPDAKATLCRGNGVKIVLVQDNALNTGRPRGGVSQQHNNIRNKFLHLIQSDNRKNDALYMKDVDNFSWLRHSL